MRSTTRLSVAGVLLCALAAIPPSLPGQSVYGTILGTVTDTSGAVVPQVRVAITNVGTREKRTLTTDSLGNFFANNVLPGQYTVEAEHAQFKKALRSGIVVEVGTTVRVDLTLTVGQTTEVVEVVGAAPLLDTATSDLGQVVDRRQMATLPLTGAGGRSFFDLVSLSAGVTTQPGVGGFALDNMRINGGRPRSDDYLMDGTSIQQIVFGGPSITPPVDSVQEFKVEINSYPAEYGRISGGIINAVTRSGTNAFHGSVYEFLRNDKLDARDFFLPADSAKNTLRQNEFGFTFGGPVRKDKLFFFGDYQGFRRSNGQVFTGIQVPTVAMKGGDFSSLLGPQMGTDACGRPIFQGAIYDPATERVAAVGDATCPAGSGGMVIRDAFPGNKIDPSLFSHAASLFLPLWPDPISGTNFNRTGANVDRINRFDIRTDYNLRDRDKIFFAFHFQGSKGFPAQPLPDERAAGFPSGKSLNDPAKTGTLAWNHTFSPSTINEFRFGYTRRNPARVPGGYGAVGPSDFGLSGFPSCTLPGSNGKCGTPIIETLRFEQISGGSMLFEPAEIFQFTDSVSKVHGRHNIKWGTDIRRFRVNNIQPNMPSGDFKFNPAETALPGVGKTGDPFASFLLGIVHQGGADFQTDFLRSRTTSTSFYIQDDFKVTPKLTLNLGLRYQMDFAWKEIFNRAANFNIFTLKWEQLGINAPRTAFDNDYNNFGPRFGFAYNPWKGWVVRGAYGVIYPGNTTRGRGGDLNPSPLLLVPTNYTAAGPVDLDSLPPTLTTFSDPNAVLVASEAFSVFTDRHQRQQYFQQWNFGIEKELPSDTLLSVFYAGSKGTKLPGQFFYNYYQLTTQQLQAAAAAGPAAVSALATLDSAAGPAGNGPIGWVFPNFNMISNSMYHSMEVRAEKRFSKGFSFLGSYTFSKLIDDASSDWSTFGGLDVQGQDFFNRRGDRSISAGDIKHRFVISYIYELPLGAGKRWANSGAAKHIAGGWEVSGITTLHTGFPFGIVDDCFGFCNPARAWANRPDVVGNVTAPAGGQTPEHWINASAYDFSVYCFNSPTGCLQHPFGDAPRYDDHARGPGLTNFDFALIKSTAIPKLGEQGRIEFRAEFFNLFNTPHLNDPVPDSFAPNLGAITSTRLPDREIQFGLKVHF